MAPRTATRTLATRLPFQLPKLAATALVCWALGANTHLDNAASTTAALSSASSSYEVPSPAFPAGDIPSMHVLSAKDASRYLTIFAAQAKGDWKTADQTIDKLDDRQLMGHVLADRYAHRPASGLELQEWLEKYADLPEAAGFYDRAVTMAGTDAKLPQPTATGPWVGSDSYEGSFGLRMSNFEGRSGAARRFAAKFDRDLHRHNPLAAATLLEGEERSHNLTPAELAKAQGLAAASFFYNGEFARARHMAEAGAKQQDILSLWIGGLSSWKENDMRAAGENFALLAAQTKLSSWDRAAAQFWAWRSLKRAGETKNAHFWLEQAAEHPHSFYGQMAASLLGNGDGWSWELPAFDSGQVTVLSGQKAGYRALALLQIGKRDLAESELRNLKPQGHRDLQEAMLALASAERMPSLALQLGGMATKPNGTPYDAALYPLPPWQPAEGFQVDPALLYALMRHESQFDPLAVSDRGACGLMQLLPATAKLMAYEGSDRASDDCSGRLLDPTVNMALGQKYMLNLAGQPLIGDNLLLLLAAYNSGPSKLGHWMHDDEDSRLFKRTAMSHRDYEKEDPLFFIESMPLHQTHDYVEQVLMHYWSYRARLGEPQTSLTDLADGKWPRLAPPEEKPLQKGMKEAALLPVASTGIVKVASVRE
jgi:soluble lytic murein transglycosylase-like protein